MPTDDEFDGLRYAVENLAAMVHSMALMLTSSAYATGEPNPDLEGEKGAAANQSALQMRQWKDQALDGLRRAGAVTKTDG
jgi:hypothetical protein